MSVEEETVNGVTVLATPPTVEKTAEELEIRRVVGQFATGVTVVTVGGPTPHGMTANAFTAVSLDPPLILVCVNRDAQLHLSVVAAQTFAVSVLGSAQQHLARHFADKARPLGHEQFTVVDCFAGSRSGAPVIREALAHLECALWRIYDGGDHWIILGRVVSATCNPGDALLFFGGQYHELTTEL